MNSATETMDKQQETANRLYWSSDETVDQVAERLGTSRRSLYDLIQPQPTGRRCPACGDVLVFTNRSSRASGNASCEACEFETTIEEAEPHASNDAERWVEPVSTAPGTDWAQGRERLRQWKDDLAAVRPQRAAMIGGAAALGVAVGAVAARVVRDKT